MSRRAALGALASLGLAPSLAPAFGQEGAFHARILTTGGTVWQGVRTTAPARWAWELVSRTSAPGRLVPSQVAADDPALLAEPFVVWPGDADIPRLSGPEVRGIERFIKLGGVLIIDDSEPTRGQFGRATRRELSRVLPHSPVVKLGARSEPSVSEHVVFKSYYLLDRPRGRLEGPEHVEAIVRGRNAQVIFLQHDLLGALARTPDGSWSLPCEPGGDRQRQYAIRFAVNLAMYVLCSNYKDDQVHAKALMRRRGSLHR